MKQTDLLERYVFSFMFKGRHVFVYSIQTFSFSGHRSFSLWSAHYPEEIRLERSGFEGRHFQTVVAARPCLCKVIPSDLKLAERRKTWNWWLGILHEVRKSIFPSNYQTEWRHENPARLLSTGQNGGNNCQIFCFFRDEFHSKENLHFTGSNFGEGVNLMQGWQKIYVFWSDLL